MRKTTRKTEKIEVPVAIAGEVKLFINLLATGEIDSLEDLLQKAESNESRQLFDLTEQLNQEPDLEDIWKRTLLFLSPPTTQALLKQECHLVGFNEEIIEVEIEISSRKLLKMTSSRISNLENALALALGKRSVVRLTFEGKTFQEWEYEFGTAESLQTSESESPKKLNLFEMMNDGLPSSPCIVDECDDLVDYSTGYLDCPNKEPDLTGLTGGQKSAIAALISFAKSQDRFFRLTGYAGTGKSFLLCRFVQWLADNKISHIAACPTNKAAKSLKNLADKESLELEVKTVAQLLGQQPVMNESIGREQFISATDIDLTGYSIVLIDEFSMLTKDNFSEIVEAVQRSLLTKVIFVGDAAQIPPVNESEPIVSFSPLINQVANLTDVVRYDGEIAHVAEAIRSDPKYSRSVYPFSTASDKTIVCMSESEWLEKAIILFESEEYRHNPDHVRFLAWRNKTVQSLNHFVRSKLWGDDALPYVPGDRLIALKPLFRPKPGETGKNKWAILINNSEECQVLKAANRLTELVFSKEIYSYWQVEVQLDNSSKTHVLNILDDDSKLLQKEQLKILVEKRRWSEYFDLSKMFDEIGYGYALTTHKAQGSTINHVFLDVDDMAGCSDRQKLLYTALTRAKIQALISSY